MERSQCWKTNHLSEGKVLLKDYRINMIILIPHLKTLIFVKEMCCNELCEGNTHIVKTKWRLYCIFWFCFLLLFCFVLLCCLLVCLFVFDISMSINFVFKDNCIIIYIQHEQGTTHCAKSISVSMLLLF